MRDVLTTEDVTNFFMDRGTWECSICKHRVWDIMGARFGNAFPVTQLKLEVKLDRSAIEERGGNVTAIVLPEYIERDLMNAKVSHHSLLYPVVMMVCQNCGFVRTHLAKFIMDRLGVDGDGSKK